MAYVWVQQWVALPVIVEEQQMGDGQPDAGIGPTSRLSAEDESHLSATQFQQGSQIQPRTPGTNAPFHTQFTSLQSFPQRVEPSRLPSHQGFGSMNPQPGQQQQTSPFNMNAIAGALPDYGSGASNPAFQSAQQQQPQRRLSGASTPAVVYQLQQSLQYSQGAPGLTNPNTFGNFPQSQYGATFGQPSGNQQQSFGAYGSAQQRLPGMQQPLPSYPQISPQHYYMAQGQQLSNYPGQGAPFPGSYGARPAQPNLASLNTGASGMDERGGLEGQPASARSESSMSAIPRGPPRKPKQSGHALWVGNLPPGATVMDLKDHFSRDATKDIESLFLISKSNCAFVNYRTEAACAAAMQRFHDSRFQGVRLVCRLRRSSAPASGTPTGPIAMTGRRPPSQASSSRSPMLESAEEEPAPPAAPAPEVEESVEAGESTTQKVPEKFFIIKSLTLQDLEQSVRTGIWATQAHNEELLNKAYQAAENVYLIFSANKSGEYFGYARMASPISQDAKEIYRSLPQPEPTESTDAPRSIPTPATETAPKGHIIDDSARGTIFWEAEHSEEEEAEGLQVAEDRPEDAQVWGKPFKIEWQSTNRLPFYRTRGLRNPWNANREVKIARDGTELETGVGRRLIQMFHRLGPSTAGAPNMPMNLGQMPPFMGQSPMQQQYPPQ